MEDFARRLERRNPFAPAAVDEAFTFASQRIVRAPKVISYKPEKLRLAAKLENTAQPSNRYEQDRDSDNDDIEDAVSSDSDEYTSEEEDVKASKPPRIAAGEDWNPSRIFDQWNKAFGANSVLQRNPTLVRPGAATDGNYNSSLFGTGHDTIVEPSAPFTGPLHLRRSTQQDPSIPSAKPQTSRSIFTPIDDSQALLDMRMAGSDEHSNHDQSHLPAPEDIVKPATEIPWALLLRKGPVDSLDAHYTISRDVAWLCDTECTCIQVIEKYSVCGCLYYIHPVDVCTRLVDHHIPEERTVIVGFACPSHTTSSTSNRPPFNRVLHPHDGTASQHS